MGQHRLPTHLHRHYSDCPNRDCVGSGTITASTLNFPTQVISAPNSSIFVADRGNNRVLLYAFPATRPIFTTQPSGATAGTVFAIQPVVTMQDQYGNTVTSFSGEVTVDIPTGGIGGPHIVRAVNGVATFQRLGIKDPGTYTLGAYIAGYAGTSNSFTVEAGKSRVYTKDEEAQINTGTWKLILIAFRDGLGNFMQSFSGAVRVSADSIYATSPNSMANAAGAPDEILSGTTTVQAVDGIATFRLMFNKPGTYVLTFTAPEIDFTYVSAPFTVSDEVIAPPADLVPQLRVTPDRVVDTNPENLVSFAFKVKNVGKGGASNSVITIPIPQGLDVGYLAEGATSGVWVKQVTATTVTIGLPNLEKGKE
ncbi:hypothetical protein, partial [Candidatus Chlorohelix sp.]|uniref:hypothetical protein n=1 Tax=Candidatus Chlorohelix sp. TaxID=3139201 RepID=UPI0030433B5E